MTSFSVFWIRPLRAVQKVFFLASLFQKLDSVDLVLQNILFKPYILKLNGAEEGFGGTVLEARFKTGSYCIGIEACIDIGV